MDQFKRYYVEHRRQKPYDRGEKEASLPCLIQFHHRATQMARLVLPRSNPRVQDMRDRSIPQVPR